MIVLYTTTVCIIYNNTTVCMSSFFIITIIIEWRAHDLGLFFLPKQLIKTRDIKKPRVCTELTFLLLLHF